MVGVPPVVPTPGPKAHAQVPTIWLFQGYWYDLVISSQQRCRFKSATLVVFLFNSFLSQPLILYGFDCWLVAGCYWMLFLKMALDLCVVEVSLSQSFRTARVAWDYKMTCRNHKDHPRLWGDQMKERRMGWFMITFWWFALWGVAQVLLLCWVWPVFCLPGLQKEKSLWQGGGGDITISP